MCPSEREIGKQILLVNRANIIWAQKQIFEQLVAILWACCSVCFIYAIVHVLLIFAGVAIRTQKGLSVWGIFLSISAMGIDKRWDLNSSYYCHWKQPQRNRCSKACNSNYSVSALLGHITCVCVCVCTCDMHACVPSDTYPFLVKCPAQDHQRLFFFQSPLKIHSFHCTFTSHLSLLWMCVCMHAFICVCVCVCLA